MLKKELIGKRRSGITPTPFIYPVIVITCSTSVVPSDSNTCNVNDSSIALSSEHFSEILLPTIVLVTVKLDMTFHVKSVFSTVAPAVSVNVTVHDFDLP